MLSRIKQDHTLDGDLTIARLAALADENQAARLMQLRSVILSLNEKINDARNTNAMLLNQSRDQLRSFLVAHGVSGFDGPSNEDAQFERVRLRAAAGTLCDLGLTPTMLGLAAERQQRAVAALEPLPPAEVEKLRRIAAAHKGGG